MHGDVVVESTPGKGSVFTFSFEAAGARRSMPSRHAVAHPMPTGLAPDQPAWKVLIVDDVPTNRDLLDELLSRVGFSTRTAASARKPSWCTTSGGPIWCSWMCACPAWADWKASGGCGRAGRRPRSSAVTASGLADTESEAREAGVDAFVRKPYREGELLAAIGERLGVRYLYAIAGPSAVGRAHRDAADDRRCRSD